MTLLAAIVMAVLMIASYLIFRSWFAPAVIYTASWTVALFSVAALQPLLYGVSGEAMFHYSVGAALFVAGTLLGQGFRRPAAPGSIPTEWKGARMRVVVNALLVLLMLATPLLAYQVASSGNLGTLISQLRDARIDSVAANGDIGSFGLLKNLPVLAQFLVLMSIYINRGLPGDRFRIVLASVLWLLVALPSGSKLIALQLPFMVAAGVAIARQQIPWRIAGFSALGFIVIFLGGLYYINFGYLVASGDSVPIHQLLATMASYAYGGVIGFSRMLNVGSGFPFTQSPLRTPMYIVDAIALLLGLEPPFLLGSEHAPFLDVGQNLSGNVYSVLYAYYGAGGVAGVCGWSLLAGLFSGWVYRAIAAGRSWAFFVYPWVVYACVMSVYSEQLFSSSLVVVKLRLLLGLIGLQIMKRQRFFGPHKSPVAQK